MKTHNTIVDFTQSFPNNEACLKYLSDLKWGTGYECIRCAHATCVRGRTEFHRRCQKCGYDESCTAHTLFHKIKFPLVKAFWITYQLGTMKKGLSTMEISRQYKIHQETAWFFKRKVQQAMNYLHGNGNKLEKFKRTKRLTVAQLVLGIEKDLDSRARTVSKHWPPENQICTSTKYPGKGENQRKRMFSPYYHRLNLRGWLKGIHHRVSERHINFYLDEYMYRYIRRGYISESLPKLFETMIVLPWLSYRTVTCGQNR